MRLITTFFAALIVFTPLAAHAAEAPAHETAYERVMRTNTLRCGYIVWPGFFEKDVNTGKFSGLFYDYMEAMAKGLNLSIDWTEEIGIHIPTALASGRIDAFCMAYTPALPRMRGVYFTNPVVYAVFEAYTRPDDRRFDNALGKINDPAIKITSLEGELNSVLAHMQFPKATLVELPQLMGATQVLLDVSTGKADVAFSDPITMGAFMASNPGKLRRVDGGMVGVFGAAIGVPVGEDRLLVLLNNATRAVLDVGLIDRLIRDYGYVGKVMPAALSYRELK